MLALTAGVTLGLLAAVQEPDFDLSIRKSADVARVVARDFGLPHWAERIVEAERPKADTPAERAELDLVLADVLKAQADRERDPLRRLELLARTGEAYGRIIEDESAGAVAQRAQSRLSSTAYAFAQNVEKLVLSGELTEEQRLKVLEFAEPFFKTALRAMNSLIDWWENLPGNDPLKENTSAQAEYYYFPQFFRAMTYIAWARLYPPGSLERDQYSQQALSHLESFALVAGPVASLRAYKLTGDAYALRGEYSDAEDYYVYVIETGKEYLDSPELDPSSRGYYGDVVQDAYFGLLQLLEKTGPRERFQEVLDDFESWLRDSGVTVSEPGFRIQLMQARQLADEGRIRDALEIADQVATDNANGLLRLEANAVMAHAIELAPPDAEIPLDLVYQAGEGSFFNEDYERAITLFRSLVARLSGSPDEAEFGARTFYYLGRSWNALDFPMLAALAYQTGAERYPTDEDYGLRCAKAWQAKADVIYRSRPSDAVLSEWAEKASRAVSEFGGATPDSLAWRNAETRYKVAQGLASELRKAKEPDPAKVKEALRAYDQAIQAYERIPEASRYAEAALVQRAIAHYDVVQWRREDADEAIRLLKTYLEEWVQDPERTPKDPFERKTRKEKVPTAAFYLARTYRKLALLGDTEAWEEMLKALEGFEERFPEQKDLADAAFDFRIEGLLALGRPDEAEGVFAELQAREPKPSRLASAAYKLYKYFQDGAAAAETATDRSAALAKAVHYLSIYNQAATRPAWANLYTEADLRLQLGEWEEAEELLRRILDQYASELNDDYRFAVEVRLVRSLLEQRRVGEAVPIVDRLRQARPNDRRVKEFTVMVKAGFLVEKDGRILEVPGEGTPEALSEAAEAANELVQIASYEAGRKDPPISPFRYAPWWEARVLQIYVTYRLGQVDPDYAGAHRRILEGLERQAPDLGEEFAGPSVAAKLKWLKAH